MNKLSFYKIVVVFLLVSNILLGILAFQLAQNKGRMPGGPKQLIIEKLDFDKKQIEAFELLVQDHRGIIREKNNAILQKKQALYGQLSLGKDSLKHLLMEDIAELQAQVEETHYQHFLDIKRLCKPSQMEKFNSFTKEITRLFPGHKTEMPPKP
jgi:hypothetical protein